MTLIVIGALFVLFIFSLFLLLREADRFEKFGGSPTLLLSYLGSAIILITTIFCCIVIWKAGVPKEWPAGKVLKVGEIVVECMDRAGVVMVMNWGSEPRLVYAEPTSKDTPTGIVVFPDEKKVVRGVAWPVVVRILELGEPSGVIPENE